ncbi:putative glutathione-specific gamma-glutamylcyclotransferase 2 [Panulirus ornatus]|uniref:putative glutathione-specific gamma-glutamylcyclotransferase 2 n=1 Tax=Panulirus ornatus TaxID=150431 RepID=UPI003A87D451
MGSQETRSLWIFGYGSLCWHPGFQFGASAVGYIRHYVRRFWQGNSTHRGVPSKPGRVATLVEEQDGATWGVAYELTGEAALRYLEAREVALGGYTTAVVTFFPRDGVLKPFPVLLYIATPASREWAGQAPLHEIATQITQCSGPSGHNVEYLLRLAEFMRENIPEGYDDHLATLEALVRLRIKENNLCLKTLMGDGPREPQPQPVAAAAANAMQQEPQAPEERRDTFQFSASLPPKKLRCLNV